MFENQLTQPLLSANTQSDEHTSSAATHFREVSDIIGVIFEFIQTNDEQKSFLNFRTVNRKFYECMPINTLAFIMSLRLLKILSHTPHYQEVAVISKPFYQPIIIAASSLKIVTTALTEGLNPEKIASQVCFSNLEKKYTTAADSFKLLCDTIATNENQTTQFKSNCGKFCRNLISFTSTCAIIGAAFFYLGLLAAAIADSKGAKGMIKKVLPKNMSGLEFILSCLILLFFAFAACITSLCLIIPFCSSIKNMLRYAKSNAYDAYGRELKTFTKKEAGMFKLVSNLLNTTKTTRVAIAAEIAQPKPSSGVRCE